jgi:hypothetical protein
VCVDDCSATASTWREPRQPIASTWREAASFSQREVRPLKQPHATTGPEVYESYDRDSRHERPIVSSEDVRYDQRRNRPEYGSRVQPDPCYRKDPAERRPRRSLSADHADNCNDRRYMNYPSQREDSTNFNSRRVDQFVEMPRFDGTGDLELFLQRFRTLVDYYGWSNSEQLFRLKNSIQGDAQYLLLDMVHLNDARDFEEALKARFGTSAHAERYRTELSRLRRGSLTIEQLYLKVRSLVSKAAPGSWSALTEIYARDAFLTALDDEKLKRRIMLTSPPPETLVAVYDLALRAVAVENYVTRCRSESRGDRHPQQGGRSRHARVVGTEDDSKPQPAATQQMEQVMEQLKELQAAVAGIKTSTAKPTEAMVDPKETSRTGRPAANQMKPKRGARYDECRNCGRKGHWARECPFAAASSASTQEPRQGGSQAKVVTSSRKLKTAVYLPFEYKGRRYQALLDSGCDVSVMGRTALPDLPYESSKQQLTAANSSPIQVLGSTVVTLVVAGATMEYKFLVSDQIDEIILGADWLIDYCCQWNFEESVLLIKALPSTPLVTLEARIAQGCIRRIYASKTVDIPARSQCVVPVKSVWNTLPPKATDWVVEPKKLQPGVWLARTLLAEGGDVAYVRIVNTQPTANVLPAGKYLAAAEPADMEVKGSTTIEPPEDFSHVQCLIDTLPSELSESQREQAAQFIRAHASVFSKSSTDLGRNSQLPHRINTGDHPPVRQPLRRQPYAHLAEIERNVQEMLAAKVIEPVASPWASNVLLVKKKDGSMRFCVDYRAVNEITIKDSYPLPRIDSCLESLGQACYFSTLDLRTGYWQTEIHKDDVSKTSFVTRSGQYAFTVLPMGLANAPSQFQRLMDLVLAGLLWDSCLVFLDDIIVMSGTFEEHLIRLGAVFERMNKARLKLKASKCQLFRSKVKFLGHVVSAGGISADPEKVRAIEEWPRPQNLHQLRSFVGLSSYYRRFIARYADIARPLHMLTEKGQPFVWKEEQEQAFIKLKRCLMSAPTLASPCDDGEYVLDTDASLYRLGAVLQQRQNGELHVISYASRLLSKTEQNYSTTRRELLAVIFGFKQFRQFLLGRHFLLRVDHSALSYLRKTPDIMGQAARWLEFIEEYDFRILHRAGQAHNNCDSLSRRPQEGDTGSENTVSCQRIAQTQISAVEVTPELSRAAIIEAQGNDPNLRILIDAVSAAKSRPDWCEVQTESEETRRLWAQYDALVMQDGLLCRKFFRFDGSVQYLQIIMPTSMRLAFLKALHENSLNVASTHLGIRKTEAHVMQRAYWMGWRKDVETYCRRCAVCQAVQHGKAPRHGLMQRYEAIGPGDRIHVDLTGPHPVSRQGSVYVLTAIDAFSRFLVAVPLRDKSAVTVATALAQHVFLPFGSCRSMVSDQGTDFCNDVLQELTRVLGIQKLRTTAYRASANGRVERVHRTLNNLLSKEISDAKQKDWQDKLPMVVAAYNSCLHESIQYTPYFLMYGRDYVTPLDLTLDLPSNVPYETYTDYVEKFRDRLRAAYTSVNTFMEAKTQRVKRAYDSKVHEIQLEPGSFAWYFCPRRKQGLYQKWRRLCGICYVEKRFTDVTYSIRTAPRAKPIIAHIDRLRKFEGEVPEVWRTAKLRATPPGTGGQAEATPPDHGDRGVPTPPAGEYRAVTEPPARVWRNPGVPSGKTTGRTDTPPDACNRQPSTALPTGEGTSRTPTGRTSAPTSLPSSAGARDNNNNNTQPGQPVHYDLRPARARRKPARLRHIQARDFETTTFIGSSKVGNFGSMDPLKDRVGHVNLELRRHPVNRRRVAANV